MTERELVQEVRTGVARLIDAVGEHRAAWALGGITATNLRRFATATSPAPPSPRTRKPQAEPAGETRWELLEEIREFARQLVDEVGQRPAARTIGKVSPSGLAKFAKSTSRPYRPLWRQLLLWYDAGCPGTRVAELTIAIQSALSILTRDLPPEIREQIQTQMQDIVRTARASSSAPAQTNTRTPVPPTRAVAVDGEAARPRPGKRRPRPDPPTSAPEVSTGLLPGRRSARFRAGHLLRSRGR